MNLPHIGLALFLLLAVTSSHVFADPFDELESYDRQQRASDNAFDNFDSEFDAPSKPRQAQPEPKIVEKIVEKVVTRIVIVEKEATRTPPPVKEKERTFFKNGLVFNLEGCTKRGGDVSCQLTVLSENTDKSVTIFSTNKYRPGDSTSFFDNNGNQYYANTGVFGNKNTAAHRHGGGVKNRIIRGITTKIKITFQNISETTSSISLLELKAHDKQNFNVTFRDVPLI